MPNQVTVALAGNPNVGKSTLFNALTGMKQHTGNWAGKTVASAVGSCTHGGKSYILADIPGTYSLLAHSAEEEIARDYICFGGSDAVAIVCDATCLERNLNLALQAMETGKPAIICLNLADEAKRKGIEIDTELLSNRLGVPVTVTVARKKKTLGKLLDTVDIALNENLTPYTVRYCDDIERAIAMLEPELEPYCKSKISPRFLSLRLIENDRSFLEKAEKLIGIRLYSVPSLYNAVAAAKAMLGKLGYTPDKFEDELAQSLVCTANKICDGAVKQSKKSAQGIADKILTGRLTAYPIMLLLLMLIFWLTVTGANYPSDRLGSILFAFEDLLHDLFSRVGAPSWLDGILISGAYRVLAWVVSVMLPPMAIFFPLFTLLEDLGYLPRIAYNLDKPFAKAGACGKQALTMCMGFGCNAAGVVGCRIIDSPRERLLAVLTNSFVPCNGRFPLLIAMIAIFFANEATSGFLSTALLCAVILLGIFMTLFVTKLLSKTLLKGEPSSFTLELPPFRKPQVWKTVVRSVFDRTLLVLGRAAAVAAPVGALIYLLANIQISGTSLLQICADILNPFAELMGLDGVILLAFILALPANEIVLPIILMTYLAEGTLQELGTYATIRETLVANGWTAVTAINVMLFSLMHWPCSTTLATVKKETGELKWAMLAAVIPTAVGIAACILVNLICSLFCKFCLIL